MIGRSASFYNAVPPDDERHDARCAVTNGMLKAGFTLKPDNSQVHDADILVTWSPWKGSRREAICKHYRAHNRPIIVMENGWLGQVPVGGVLAETHYQLALDGWNGTGRFPIGGWERWQSWGIRLQFYRNWTVGVDGYALVIGQRGHPLDQRSAPPFWHEKVELPYDEKWIIRRPQGCSIPLAKQLSGAAEVHVWTSNVATHALIGGVPVVRHGPNGMLAELCSIPGQPLVRYDRTPHFANAAWAQWSASELSSGAPFTRLLEMARA